MCGTSEGQQQSQDKKPSVLSAPSWPGAPWSLWCLKPLRWEGAGQLKAFKGTLMALTSASYRTPHNQQHLAPGQVWVSDDSLTLAFLFFSSDCFHPGRSCLFSSTYCLYLPVTTFRWFSERFLFSTSTACKAFPSSLLMSTHTAPHGSVSLSLYSFSLFC